MTTSPVTTPAAATVIGGVDTHKHTHYAAAVDEHGRLLDHREFPATPATWPSWPGFGDTVRFTRSGWKAPARSVRR